MKFGIFVAAGLLALGASAFATTPATASATAPVQVIVADYVSIAWTGTFDLGTVTYPGTASDTNEVEVFSNAAGHISFTGTGLNDPAWNADFSSLVDTPFPASPTGFHQTYTISVRPSLAIAPGVYAGPTGGTVVATASIP